tara:strand:+ start:2444 stop:3298 length:855 start_codon:yes stop_codon:yes gene_type:complete
MELKITQQQLRRLVEQTSPELSSIEEVRGYTFDWDDNILFMPTKIKLLYTGDGKKEIKYVTTTEYAEIRENPDYQILDDSFSEFRNEESFYKDLKYALNNKKYGPSFDKFKESLLYANPFAIITARSAPPEVIKKGVRIFIGEIFNEEELEVMINNIKRNYKEVASEENPENIINYYLNQNDYQTVSSPEFQDKYQSSSGVDKPEEGKKIALLDYVEKVVSNAKHLVNNRYKRLSIGFSDDDKKNVEAIKSFIQDELLDEYPQVNFVVYDTSDGTKNKLIIKKV